jgi:hypothetical protein
VTGGERRDLAEGSMALPYAERDTPLAAAVNRSG